jgi:uncharacterized protein YaiL (DUF2058 family)
MSMSLREQLLQAGLVSQKQVKDAERLQERQTRQVQQQKRGPQGGQRPAPPERPDPARAAQAAKIARDQALNRQQQEKAAKKALLAQIKQLIDQNRVPPVEGDDFYNFVDGSKIRHIAVNAAVRGGLYRGEILIVRHEGRYHLVPAAAGAQIREREPGAIVAAGTQESPPTDAAYQAFTVPDDLIW